MLSFPLHMTVGTGNWYRSYCSAQCISANSRLSLVFCLLKHTWNCGRLAYSLENGAKLSVLTIAIFLLFHSNHILHKIPN